MKFSITFLSFLALVATFSGSTFGEKDSASNLRKNDNENNEANGNERFLTEGLSIPTESRIVGGEDAPDGAYPFFVSWGGCGASLVADNIILSAAHCKEQATNTVTIGQSRKGNNPNGVERTITTRVPHPSYRSFDINFDYLVMVLDQPVDTDVYPPIGLNSQSSIPTESEELTVIGFGALSQGGYATPQQLQEVEVNYILSRTCNRGFSSYNGDVKDPTMFCAGTNGGKDSCQGDSGGPIFTKGDSIQQVGIVSWGRGCAQRRYPGVYSRVSGEYGWIRSVVCDLANTKPNFCKEDYTPDPEIPNSNDDEQSDDETEAFIEFLAKALCRFFTNLPFCDDLTN